MSRIFNLVNAALGGWLIVAISVFPRSAALWIAFATAIAITAAAAGLAGVAFVRRGYVQGAVASATVALGAFLIVASLVFEKASTCWLMAIAGGVVEAVALGSFVPTRTKLVAIDSMRQTESFAS